MKALDPVKRVFLNILDRGPVDHPKINLIARQLGLRPHAVKSALRRLVELGLATTDSQRFVVTLREFDDPKTASAAFDLALTEPTQAQEGETMAKATSTKTATPRTASAKAPPVKCGCGCGKTTASGKSAFLPGHDARWISNLVKSTMSATANDNLTQTRTRIASIKRDVKDKTTDALAAKFEKNATNAANKRAAKASAAKARSTAQAAKTKQPAKKASTSKKAAAEPETLTGVVQDPAHLATGKAPTPLPPVKVGRWEYPSQQETDGSITRNTKKDGTGKWVPVEATV